MGRWSRSVLVLLLMLCGATLILAQDQAAKPEWKEYPYPEDGFALTTPSKPTFQKQQQATASGNIEMRQYSVDLANDAQVLMSVSDFPTAENGDPKTILETAVTGSVQATKAKKTSEKDIGLQQIPGIEYEADGDTFHMRGRYYWSKGRLFSMLAVAPIGTPIPDDAVRIFDSLKFLNLPKQAWKEYSYADEGFAMTAPSQPNLKKQEQATAAGNVETRQYSVDLGSDFAVMMSVNDFPNAKDVSAKTLLEGGVNGSIQATKSKKISEKDIELQQVPGIEFEAEGDAFHMRGRYYWAKGRLFSFLAVAPLGTPIPDSAVRVFDSLKFLDLPKSVWKEYSYADEGFALTVPSQPTLEKQQQPTASGNIELRLYSVHLASESEVMMSVSDYPNANHATPKQALEGAVNGSTQGPNAKKTSEKDIELQQVPGIEFEGESSGFHMFGRYYWKSNRLFSLVTVSPLGEPVPADALQVMDSLKFVTK
jgi:hypothetical protein